MFAAIVGRSLKAIAASKLEQGTSIGLIEQLLGSKTVVSAVTSQFKVHTLNFLTPGLIILWAFSPLGSQAALKAVAKLELDSSTSASLEYLNTQSGFSIVGGSSFDSLDTQINAIFISALISPVSIKTAPQDAWGNVKVPMLESLAADHADDGGWHSLGINSQVQYSSLIGLFLHPFLSNLS